MNIHSCKTKCAVLRPDIIINAFQPVEGDEQKTSKIRPADLIQTSSLSIFVRLDSEKIGLI